MKSKFTFFVPFLLLLPIVFIILRVQAIWPQVKGTQENSSKLFLIPQGFAEDPQLGWQLPVNQDIKVNIVLATGNHQVDVVEAVLNYDPKVLSAKEIDFDSNQLPALRNTLIKSIKKEANGQEAGVIHIARTAIPLPPYDSPDVLPPYTPVAADSQGIIATITFHTRKAIDNSSLIFEFEEGGKNDSNVVKYQGMGEDVLGAVENLTFAVVPPQKSATLELVPSSGTFYLGQPFEVQIILHTGQFNIDSADVVIFYDREVLKAIEVREGDIFAQYAAKEGKPDYIDEENGKIEISGQVATAEKPQYISGNNLVFGTIVFEPLAQTSQTNVSFDFVGFGERNDSNVIQIGKAEDVLGQVIDASYSFVPKPIATATPTPTLTPIPTTIPTPPAAPTPVPTITPTPTLISTPTPPPEIKLDLKIFLQGRAWTGAKSNRRVKIEIPAVAFETQVITDEFGLASGVTLTNLPPGKYQLLVKPRGFLQEEISIDLSTVANIVDLSDLTFLAGDLDGSGKINSLDYNYLLVKFKTDDELADLDGSKQVNSLDFSLMLVNWNKQGDGEGQ